MSGQNRKAARGRRSRSRFWAVAEWCSLSAGVVLLTIFGAARARSWLVQAYAEWSFEQALRLEPAPWANHDSAPPPARSGLGPGIRDSSAGIGPGTAAGTNSDGSAASSLPGDGIPTRPATTPKAGSTATIGRLQIPAIRLSAMVLDGDDSWSLNGAIGHVTGTAYPGEPGNSALAGHRDSFFRNLRKITVGDTVIFTSLRGNFEYCVDEVKIVGPASTWVLAPSRQPTLTLVTCFPFDYIGPAPRRFIVRARLLARSGRGGEGRGVEAGVEGSDWRGGPEPAANRAVRNR